MLRPRSLRTQLNAIFVVMILTMSAALALTSYWRDRKQAFGALHDASTASLARLQTSLPTAIWDMDDAQTRRLITAELGSLNLIGITVTKAGKVLAVRVHGVLSQELTTGPDAGCK